MELRGLIRDWYCVDRFRGRAGEEIAAVKDMFGDIPAAVENFTALLEVMEGLGEPV